jgi:GNAT superfamily N-acetyltransferase
LATEHLSNYFTPAHITRTMHLITAPFLPEDLDALVELEPPDWEGLLAHLRWKLATPYALVLKAVLGEALVAGVGSALVHNGTAWIGALHVHPGIGERGVEAALVQALVHAVEAQGCRLVSAVVREAQVPLFESLHFHADGAHLRLAGGRCEDPTEDEVELLEPRHALGVWRLDQRASGEDRRTWINEHLYAGRVYVHRNRVQGIYLPLLGEGLVLADNAHAGEELLRWHLQQVTSVVVPEANPAAVDFLRLRKYTEVERSVRMVRGDRVAWRPEMEFARAGR